MSKLKLIALALGVFVAVAAVAPSAPSMAASPIDQVQTGVNDIGGKETGTSGSLTSMVRKVVNTLLFIIGAVAVVMIIYGGFSYITSRGESAGITSAKNTILYAVVGLVIAILAYAIVNFVVGAFQSKPAETEKKDTNSSSQSDERKPAPARAGDSVITGPQ